jgi:hypothetical protein
MHPNDTGLRRTSVRGGYAMFFESFNSDSRAQENPPFFGKT